METEYTLFCYEFSDEELYDIIWGRRIQMTDEVMINNKTDSNIDEVSTKEKNSQTESKKKSAKTTKVSSGDEANSCSSLADEDYIVFCFNDDGGIDLEEIKKKKTGKLLPDENDGNDIKDITEVEQMKTDLKSIPPSLSESTRSDSSSGSFAFPVMNWELKGSPERMPKLEKWRKERQSESEEEQRHKGWRNIRFHCCGF